MGRHNGSWSPVYGQAWTHPKTGRASAWLVVHGKRITSAIAPFLVLGWLNRLCVWCLGNSETGSLAGLSAARIATLAWPEAIEGGMPAPKAGEAILGALRAGGFVVGDPPRIHDFADHHSRILKERTRKRHDHDAIDGIGAEDSADHSAERGAEHSAEPSASTGSGSGSGTGSGTGSGSGRAAAAALLPEFRDRIRWHGTDEPILKALDDFAAAGMDPAEIRAAMDRHAAVGLKPLSLRDAVLEARRRAGRRPAPDPCIDCRAAPRAPGRAVCHTCAAPARERATAATEAAPAAPEAPERGYRVNPAVQSCAPRRPTWRTVRRPSRIPFDPEE